jgi:protein-S-isoprenylcysteine O-methyltransferase Ste14
MIEKNDDLLPDEIEDHFAVPPDNANLKFLPPYYFIGAFLAGVFLELFIGINLFPWKSQIIIGIPFIGAGCGLFFWALKTMLHNGENPSPDEPTVKIIDVGPYKFSRNPIYLSYLLFYFGLAVLFDIVWTLVLFIPLIIIVTKYVIEPEEDYLGRKFGADYADYKTFAGRWI